MSDIAGAGIQAAGGLLGSIVGAVSAATTGVKMTRETNEANKQIARETNAANLQIAQETNAANIAMNAENNALQQDLANKAYERSTASNQIAELIRAGYTQQQAMQAVLGNGDSAAMPMPTTAAGHADPAVMQPATMQTPDLSGLYGNLQQMGSSLGGIAADLVSENGGSFGYLQSLGYINSLNDMISKGTLTPDWLLPIGDLREKYNSLGDSDEDNLKREALDKFFSSQEFKSVLNSPMAQRSVNSYLRSNLAYKSESQQIKESYQRVVESQKRSKLVEKQVSLTDIQNAREQLAYMMSNELFDSELELGFATIRNTILEANRSYDINSRAYDMFVANAIKDVSVQSAILEVLRLKNAYEEKQVLAATNALSPDMQLIFGYYKVFQDCGLLDASLWGGIASTLGSVSAEITNEIKALIEKIKMRNKSSSSENETKNPFKKPPHQTRTTEGFHSII